MRQRTGSISILVVALSAAACGQDAAPGSLVGNLNKSLTFPFTAKSKASPMPTGSATGPQVTPFDTSMPLELKPNSQVTIVVPWNGGIISYVDIGFSGSSTPLSYIELTLPPEYSGQTGGSLIILTQVGDVCQGLPRTCQEAHCTAQVVSPQGDVSLPQTQRIITNCSGAASCSTVTDPMMGTPGCSTEATMCSGGGSGKSCWDGSGRGVTYVLTSDGTRFTCAVPGSCLDALNAFTAWCNAH
jgi:hypothetical protein